MEPWLSSDMDGKPGSRMSERVKITKDVRKYAAEQRLAEAEALESGMHDKANEFVEQCAEVYVRR